MHLKVFVKLKKNLKTLSSGQKNPKKPKKTQKNPKNPKKPKKTQKTPLGWVFLKKPGFFPTLKGYYYHVVLLCSLHHLARQGKKRRTISLALRNRWVVKISGSEPLTILKNRDGVG
jgi:hypothetical protein